MLYQLADILSLCGLKPQALSGEEVVEGEGGEAVEWDSIRPTTSMRIPATIINHDTDP